MTIATRDAVRLIQSGLDQLGHPPDAIDGLSGLRTARALKSLLAANGFAAAVAPPDPLPWITEAKTALGHHEARDRCWLLGWLKRDGRSLEGPSRNPWRGDFVETCIRVALPNEPLLGALGAKSLLGPELVAVRAGNAANRRSRAGFRTRVGRPCRYRNRPG